MGWGSHRLRLRRALGFERIRRRIAMDLHDDLGAGLAQVAILSDWRDAPTRSRSHPCARDDRPRHTSPACAMGDVVWAVDPRRDRLADLVERVRELATSMLESDGINVRVALDPEPNGRIVLHPDFRRQVWLFSAEAITNIARHARASHATIRFQVAGRNLLIEVSDDGVGFDASAVERGLNTLRGRTESMNGRLAVTAAPGARVRLEATIPIVRARSATGSPAAG